MRKPIHALLIVLMLWLPFSQAMAVCCWDAAQPESQAMVMLDHCAEHETDDAQVESHDCVGDCVQLGQLAVPALALSLTASEPAPAQRVVRSAGVLPAHQYPLLKPPRLLA